jgi:predicted dehydrogenase
MTAVRVAVVGAGKMGAHHARVFAANKGATLVGVLDVDRHRAEHVARNYGLGALRTLDEAIERADLVVLATPTAHHFSQALRVIEAGRAVLVEKPIAASAPEARALCDAARARGVALLVGHSERFNAVVRALATETEDDDVLAIATSRSAAAPAASGAQPEELCTNLAVHDIDLAAVLARAPVELVGCSGTVDEASLMMRAGVAVVTTHVARGVTRRVRTLGLDTATVRYEGDLLAGTLKATDRSDPNDRVVRTVNPAGLEPLALQAEAALAAFRGEPSNIASGLDGLRAVAVAERAAMQLTASAAE